jgi:peptidoglycan/LPS O-acetylase OafA/YrhL
LKYRPEIDGLRALAIIPVILFHAGFGLFSGGYVGVDIFFVISGYLITTIILNEMKKGHFSLVRFYERRARRILPALFFVILLCLPFAWIWLTPSDMQDFAQSLIGVATFSSNIFFWQESGYFDTAAELKPLLHTWSLAVEEQYYILFPLLLMVFWRYGKRAILYVLIFIFIVSLGLADWRAYNEPTAGFFLLSTRAWEILLGAFSAFYLNVRTSNNSSFLNQLLSLLGLLLIGVAIFTFDQTTPTPSLYTLIPTIGVVLLILFANQGTYVKYMLSSPLLVGFGLISYSAYLWHQPLFAFARHSPFSSDLGSEFYGLLIIASTILAWLTWKYIETPFRHRTSITNKQVAQGGVGLAFIFIIIGCLGYFSNGFNDLMKKYKYDEETNERIQLVIESTDYDAYDYMYDDGNCAFWVKDSKNILTDRLQKCYQKHGGALVVLGDSHAMNLYNIIAKSDVYPFVIGVSQGGCRPHNNYARCHYDSFNRFVKEKKELIGGLIYHQSGSYFIKDTSGNVDSQNAFEGSYGGIEMDNIEVVDNYLLNLQSALGSKILWIGPFVEYRFNAIKEYGIKGSDNINPESINVFKELNLVMKDTISVSSLYYFLPFKSFFDAPQNAMNNNCFVFRDIDHFSHCGEDLLSKSEKLKLFDWHHFMNHEKQQP